MCQSKRSDRGSRVVQMTENPAGQQSVGPENLRWDCFSDVDYHASDACAWLAVLYMLFQHAAVMCHLEWPQTHCFTLNLRS